MIAFDRGLHEVGDGLFAYLQPDGGWGWSNAGLVVGGSETLLVDTLFDLPLTETMLGEMRRAVPAAERVGTLVNTHANGDHCYGNRLVEGARIVASAAAVEEMAEVPPQLMAALLENAPTMGRLGEFFTQAFGGFEFAGNELRLPEDTFSDALSLTVGDREVRLRELGPAHTRGDVIVHLPAERVLFAGDLLFEGRHPIAWAGPVAHWIAALDEVLALDVDIVVPGHGAVCDLGAVREEKAYFEYLVAEGRARWERGMTPLEAARDLTLDRWARWPEGERLAVNLATLWREWDGDEEPADVVELWGQMAELALG